MMAMILGDTEKQEREEHKKKMFMVLSQLAYIRSGQLDNILSWGELDDDELDRLEEEQDIPDYLAWFPDYALDEGDEDRRKDVFAFPSQQSDWWWRNTGLDRKFCEPFWWLDVVEALNSGSTLAVMKLLE